MLHKKIEFARLCGVKKQHVHTYIKRGKIIVTEAGLIDDTNPINHDFLKRQTDPGVMKTRTAKTKEKKGVNPQAPAKSLEKPKIKQTPPPVKNKTEDTLPTVLESERRLKHLQVQRASEQVDLLKIEKTRKVQGSITVDGAKFLVQSLTGSLAFSMKYALDQFVDDVALRFRLPRAETAPLRGKVIDTVNQAIERGREEARKTIQEAAQAAKEKRMQGEKENSVRTNTL